jgi:hypothetical protein
MRERRRAGAKQDGANPHASPNHDKGEEAGDNDPVMAGPNLVTVNKELQSRPCIEGNSHQRDVAVAAFAALAEGVAQATIRAM